MQDNKDPMHTENAQGAEPPPHTGDPEQLAAAGKKVKRLAVVVAILLIAGFAVVQYGKSSYYKDLAATTSRDASAPPPVDVIVVKSAPATFPLTLPGETAGWYESTIYARVNGYVATWLVDIGDRVKRGQVLATIDTPELDAQLAAAQAKLKASQALVLARQADADFAKTTHERWKNSPKGVVSEQERDDKKAAYDKAVAQLNEAKAQVGLDKAEVGRYTALTEFKQVVAPYGGTITERRIDIGNLVTAGSGSTTTPLYRMVQDRSIRVFVDVPQSSAQDIKSGLPAQVVANHIPGRVFEGQVARTADSINQQTRTLRVEVDIPNDDHALVAGLYVNVTFQLPSEGLVQIPAAALVFRSSGPHVAVINKDNKVAFRKVTISRDDGKTVSIRSGIAEGDKVALNISSQIAEGQTIELHEFTAKEGAPNVSVRN